MNTTLLQGEVALQTSDHSRNCQSVLLKAHFLHPTLLQVRATGVARRDGGKEPQWILREEVHCRPPIGIWPEQHEHVVALASSQDGEALRGDAHCFSRRVWL